MGRLQRKTENNLNKEFPDEKLTTTQLGRLRTAIDKAGNRQKYLIKKGALKLKEDGSVSVVYVEGIKGQEVIKGTGLRYPSNTPIEFWDKAFRQLDGLEYGLNKGKKQLEEFAESFKN